VGYCFRFFNFFEIFNTELSTLKKSQLLAKDAMNDKLIEFCIEYTKYRDNTQNPKLPVMQLRNDNMLLVYTPDGTRYLTKNLSFSLQVQEILDYEGVQTSIESLELADCTFIESGDKYAFFKISNWSKRLEDQEQIKKLKSNQDFDTLKPFIRLNANEIAEQFSHSEMKSYLDTRQKLKTINEES